MSRLTERDIEGLRGRILRMLSRCDRGLTTREIVERTRGACSDAAVRAQLLELVETWQVQRLKGEGPNRSDLWVITILGEDRIRR